MSSNQDRPPVADRIRLARTALGIEPGVAAARLGVNFESYADLEWFDDEVFTTLSLTEVLSLAEMLHLSAVELLTTDDHGARTAAVSMSSLMKTVRARIKEEGTTVESFGDRIGWDIASAVADPSSAWQDWNVDCLIDVCTAVGVEWPAILSSASQRDLMSQ
jgi:hypothetical protein